MNLYYLKKRLKIKNLTLANEKENELLNMFDTGDQLTRSDLQWQIQARVATEIVNRQNSIDHLTQCNTQLIEDNARLQKTIENYRAFWQAIQAE